MDPNFEWFNGTHVVRVGLVGEAGVDRRLEFEAAPATPAGVPTAPFERVKATSKGTHYKDRAEILEECVRYLLPGVQS